MEETANSLDHQIEAIIAASFAHSEGDEQDTPAQDDRERRVIDVDLYHLEGGAVLLVPHNGTNPLDGNSVESVIHTPHQQVPPETEVSPIPLGMDEQHKAEPRQEAQLESASTRRRVHPSLVLVPLLLLLMLALGVASFFFLVPLAANATITITPKTQSLHSDTTLTIATTPKAGQVQGRPLQASSFTKSITVPATGHAHDDATNAAGVLTFYNADAQGYTIPAGTSFTVQGVTVVSVTTVTVQAAVPPSFGIGITAAHVIQTGSIGNLAAHTISTRCCGSPFVTATNTTPFSGGQDARDYSYIQRSDIQNAATDLLGTLTRQATAQLQQHTRPREQLVTPLCRPYTTSSQEPGTASASVTVSVTQTCSSVAYLTDSLNEVATSALAHRITLATYEQVATTQVTVNGSTYANHTATLNVSLSGTWIYRFTKHEVQQLIRHLAGESQQEAKATLERVDGVAQVSIHLQRLDFRTSLPTNPQKIMKQVYNYQEREQP